MGRKNLRRGLIIAMAGASLVALFSMAKFGREAGLPSATPEITPTSAAGGGRVHSQGREKHLTPEKRGEAAPEFHELREVGETANFSGYRVVKVEPQWDDEERLEVSRLREQWAEESAEFLVKKLGISPAQLRGYSRVSVDSFADFERKTKAIANAAKTVYGPDIALIIEGDLEAESKRAWESYDRRITEIFGERVVHEFEGFKERFYATAHDRLGFVPSFIR